MEYQSFTKMFAINMNELSIPMEEKKFVTSVGNMSLYRFLHCKKNMYMHKRILDWDDSAGEKAFRKAKKRYFAEINGYPCKKDLPLPTYSEDLVDPRTDLQELYNDWDRPDSFFAVEDYEEEEQLKLEDIVATGWDD